MRTDLSNTKKTSSKNIRAIDISKSLLVIVMFLSILTMVSGQDQETAPEESLLEKWKGTLQFGIDSAVIGVIDEMENSQDFRLTGELVDIFSESRNLVQTRIIDFFKKNEITDLIPVAKNELFFYQDLPVPLVRNLIEYIDAFPPDDVEELKEIFEEMSEGTNLELSGLAIRSLGIHKLITDGQFFIDLFEKEGQGPGVKISAIQALAQYESELILDFLEDLAENDTQDQLQRQTAIQSLGKIGAERTLPLLKRLLDSTDPFIRTAVLGALGSYDQEEITPLYRTALRDSFWRVRLSVLQSLARNVNPQLEDIILYISRNDPEVPVRNQAYRTMEVYGTPRVWDSMKTDLLAPRTPEGYKLLLTELLVKNRYLEYQDVFLELIEQEWGKENSRILDTIGRNLSVLSHKEALGVFERFLSHPNIVIKIYGIRGLGNAGGVEYRDQLEGLAEDSNAQAIRVNARTALEALDNL